MFDLSSVEEVGTADIQILHPVTGEPTGAIVTVMGPEHPERRKIQFALQRRLRAAFAKKGRLDVSDPEEEAAEDNERLASFTVGWEGIARDGKPLEFSRQAAIDLYSRPEAAWLKRQVQAGLGNIENFIRTSGSD